MAFELRESRWSLFKNKKKEKDSDSDYTGHIKLNGEEFWLNGWINEGQNGKYLSGTIKPKQQQQQAKPKVVGGRDFDDPTDDLEF